MTNGKQDLNKLAAKMDNLNVNLMISLSEGSSKSVVDAIDNIQTNQPSQFVLFANLNFNNQDDNWGERAAAQLERDYNQESRRLKIFKHFDFSVKEVEGRKVAFDDLRVDPVWVKCAELGIPVLTHTAEPK